MGLAFPTGKKAALIVYLAKSTSRMRSEFKRFCKLRSVWYAPRQSFTGEIDLESGNADVYECVGHASALAELMGKEFVGECHFVMSNAPPSAYAANQCQGSGAALMGNKARYARATKQQRILAESKEYTCDSAGVHNGFKREQVDGRWLFNGEHALTSEQMATAHTDCASVLDMLKSKGLITDKQEEKLLLRPKDTEMAFAAITQGALSLADFLEMVGTL